MINLIKAENNKDLLNKLPRFCQHSWDQISTFSSDDYIGHQFTCLICYANMVIFIEDK